jgi:hypothetical protein
MFSNAEVIRLWNLSLYEGLRTHREYGNTFGDLFIEMIPLLRQLYSQYSENYERAMETYERLKSNKSFSNWLEQRKLELNDTKDLRSYLFLPIQRMIAYTSLLSGILAMTPQDHEDFIHLASAVQALRSASAHADDLAVQRKNIDHIIMIHNRFTDGTQIALPFRRFIYEGEISLQTPAGAKDRYMLMFNDILLIAKVRKKNKLTTDFIIPLDTLRVADVRDSKRGRYQLRLITSAGDYVVGTPEKDQWLTLLQNKPDQLGRVKPYRRPSDDDLLQRIFHWAQMDDPVLVHTQIRQFAQSLIPPVSPPPSGEASPSSSASTSSSSSSSSPPTSSSSSSPPLSSVSSTLFSSSSSSSSSPSSIPM